MQRAVTTGVGRIEYELIKTQRKSLEVRVTPNGSVRVFAPKHAPLRACDAFVQQRARWVLDTRAQLRAYQQTHQDAHPVHDGARLLYEGQPLRLTILPAARNAARFGDDELVLHAKDPEMAREQLKSFLTEQARQRVEERLTHFAPLVGRAPGRVSIRDQKTRWGSCSSQKNLNFNYKLIMAPPGALDYVVVHELCHLFEFNHSKQFWARVERHMPDYSYWKTWLKQNGKLLGV